MNQYQETVKDALEAITIHSATCYSWFGQRSQPLSPRLRSLVPFDSSPSVVLYAMLRQQLYRDLYCQGVAAPARPEIDAPLPPRSGPFVEALSAANAGRGSHQPGWRVLEVRGERVVVGRDGIRALARREDLVTKDPVRVVGTLVDVRLPKELKEATPGFYVALGHDYLDTMSGTPIVRFYWNLRSSGAEQLVNAATTRLNARAVPFQLKVLNKAEQYMRCDAGVLYVGKHDLGAMSRILPAIYSSVATQLKPLTPAFTKRLAPGLGLAEEPSSGGSFGRNRCALLAEGVLRVHQERCRTTAERLAVVAACFGARGVDLDAPFLNPGSDDEYAFPAI